MMNKKLYALCIGRAELVGLTEDPEVASIWEDSYNLKLNKRYGTQTDGVIRLAYEIEPEVEIGALDEFIKS